MPNSDLLPSLLFKINENQLALEAAIMELSDWAERHGAGDVADNVRGALDTIDRNEALESAYTGLETLGNLGKESDVSVYIGRAKTCRRERNCR
jgi:hypothetical protein